MTEVWRPIPGFPVHEASSFGRIRRTTNGRGRAAPGLILKQRERPSGYLVVSISAKKWFVHRLVCTAFHGDPAAGDEASHENGVKGDNRPVNLLWRSRASNEAMKEMHGTRLRGSRCGAARLDETAAMIIRSAGRLGWGGPSRLADMFGVSRTTVSDILNNRTWRHIE